MSVRTVVKAGGAIAVATAAVVGPQSVGSPVEARSSVVHASGTFTLLGGDNFEIVPGPPNQCVLDLHQNVAIAGTLEGTNSAQSRIRWFAPCDEVFATDGAGIVSTFRAVGQYTGDDGRQATFRQVGRTDAAGDYRGIVAVSGDLNGILHETAPAPPPGGPLVSTYEGILVENG